MALFTFIAGVLVGAAACRGALPLWRTAAALRRRRSAYVRPGAVVASFALAAGIFYLAIGSGHSLERPGLRSAASADSAASAGKDAARTAKPLDAEVAGLQARRAYDFLDRSPLPVVRATVSTWPMSFRLDDSLAMIPSRRLSQFDRVVIEARISRSGRATPAAGDLYVTSEVLRPAARTRLAFVINREVG